MADDEQKSFGGQVRDVTKERIAERIGSGIANVGSGGGSGGSNYSGGGHYGFVVIVALFLVLVLFGGPLYAECEGSGFCENRIKEPIIDPIVEVFTETSGFVGGQLKQTRAVISGEQTFSWTSEVENRDRSGVWFDNERAYGVSLGEDESGTLSILGSEFGAIVNIVVGKMDENIKELNAELECSLGDIKGTHRGVIATSDNGEIKLFPPSETEETSIHGPFDCAFSKEQMLDDTRTTIRPGLIKTIEGKPYFSEDIVFNLTYSLSPTISMPVFVIQDRDTYDYYKGRYGDAFDDLAEGSYSEYSRGVNSKIQYDSDVQAVLQIPNQPIHPDAEALIGVQFKNKDIENIAKIEKFNFTLPEGLSISGGTKINVPDGGSCDWFVGNGAYYEFNLNHPDVIHDLKDLNKGLGETRPFLCKLKVDKSVLRNVDLLKLGDIEGTLKYSYTISETVKLSN